METILIIGFDGICIESDILWMILVNLELIILIKTDMDVIINVFSINKSDQTAYHLEWEAEKDTMNKKDIIKYNVITIELCIYQLVLKTILIANTMASYLVTYRITLQTFLIHFRNLKTGHRIGKYIFILRPVKIFEYKNKFDFTKENKLKKCEETN